MTHAEVEDDDEGSTTWVWRRVKMSKPPEALRRSPSEARPAGSYPPRDMRKVTNVTLRFRGGSECWWEVKTMQGVIRVPGYTALHDIGRIISGGTL